MTPQEEKEQEEGMFHGCHGVPDGATFAQMPDIELASWQASGDSELVRAIIAEKEWQRRERIEQHENNKNEIELQHQKNTELVKEQVKWVKISAIVTATATILAALLGWYLADKSQGLKEQLRLKSELLQQIELRTKNTTSETPPERTPDKVPSLPPKK